MSIFKKLIASRRQSEQEKTIQSISEVLLKQAKNISQRAVRFTRSIKDSKGIKEVYLDEFRYPINQPCISPICSKILNQGDGYAVFRCYDCMQSVSSCICAECFTSGDHKGHNYIQYSSIGGCCDCGNEQSWNQKGFCKIHGKQKEVNFQIQPIIQNLYFEQLGLAFSFYFYLVQCKKANSFKERYGSQLFSHLITLCRQNYQMKFLAFKLFSSPLPQGYKEFGSYTEDTILHRIFKQEASDQLKKFVQLTFQIFPVEQFRILMLQEYFQKIKEPEAFTADHPLAMLNFQFLSCVKLLNKLISQKKLQPFLLDRRAFQNNKDDLPEAFKKYYEDLNYINNMNSSKQYHILHLTLSNVCDLCFYTEVTTVSSLLYIQNSISQFDLDEIFLKTFAHFVKHIIGEKRLIEKCLRELFDTLLKEEVNLISLAHDRAFTMLVYAYFDGNIYQLLNEQTHKKFNKIFGNNKDDWRFQKLIKRNIASKLKISERSERQAETNQYARYFLKLFPQKNLDEFLDIGFHKIMLMICKQTVDYSLIVADVVNKIKVSIEYQQKEYQNTGQQEQKDLSNYQTLYTLLNFLNCVTRIKIDEVVISIYIGISKQKEIFTFYKRLLSTFKNLNSKEFKSLALSIINDQQVLELFIKNHCIIEKGKISTLDEGEPLETNIYQKFFQKYERKMDQVDPYFLKNSVKLQEFQQFIVINSETISKITQILMNSIFQLTNLSINNEYSQLFSLICLQCFKIYLENNTIKDKSFFNTLLNPSFRPFISKSLLEQITLIQKESQQLVIERQKIKNEKALLNKKKRQKLLAKKKEKQFSMKQTQEKILTKYESQQCIDECIFCKSSKNQQLCYISYIGLTNFYEQNIENEKGYHVYLETCGHKIHSSCYDNAIVKNNSRYCILCKRVTNILIPQISEMKKEISQQRSTDIIVNLQAAVINEREQVIPQAKDNDPFLKETQINFYEILLDGLVKDMLYIGLRDVKNYRHSRYLIHYQIYLLLKNHNNCEIKQAFKNIKKKMNRKYQKIECFVENKLEQLLLGIASEPIQTKQLDQRDIQVINDFFLMFKDPKAEIMGKSLNLFKEQTLFASLPEILGQMCEYMGECKMCKHFTNYIYICLKCGWTCCRKCLDLMHKHSTYFHLDGSIFISCTNGEVQYLHAGKIFEDDSIYENYLGQPFMVISLFSEATKAEKFKLNQSKLDKLKMTILQYGIHQKILLNE